MTEGEPVPGRLRAPTGRYGGKTAEERQAERRRRFLDAALQLFGDTPGFRATTVAALSEAAGLSTRQFYEEFRTLEDVLAALRRTVAARRARYRHSSGPTPGTSPPIRAGSASPSSRSSASARAWRSSGSPAGPAG
ncbi:hypothetical protein STAFG_3128 [Streptomyces afghaniensis 772]|uniref:HTH tetR-type domain-containing protein n=1 Tax=Streptomyces afghaniensis 772 TaxID=1283301 RepID=S4MJX3_9ACTN|nr:hypothetical protein STAFG_3128 [Streptomyces afghaniensis 772]